MYYRILDPPKWQRWIDYVSLIVIGVCIGVALAGFSGTGSLFFKKTVTTQNVPQINTNSSKQQGVVLPIEKF